MGIQPSLFMMDTALFTRFVAKERGAELAQCPRLTPGFLLDSEVVWNRFLIRSDDCCPLCAPRPEPPLSLTRSGMFDAVLRHERGLPKQMYLWAKLHWDDAFSWMRATDVEDGFWHSWAALTQRTVHLTVDTDGRGLCGFLTPDELLHFDRQLSRIERPDPHNGPDGLDLFESEEEFESLLSIREYAQECMRQRQALAWVHDFVH